jgi:catechol 2,3-dioxygenase-like lactoylglutathione lyase family enzyme
MTPETPDACTTPLRGRTRTVRGLGETVLRVRDLETMRDFYSKVLGLEVLRQFEHLVFLRVGDGHAGHTQIVGLFDYTVPVPLVARVGLAAETTTLHHFALEIGLEDYWSEKERLERLGVPLTTAEHPWCHWRSIYLRDPEANIVELVCYDASVH